MVPALESSPENILWLGKVLLQELVGGDDNDIEKIWEMIGPKAQQVYKDRAMLVLHKIWQRAQEMK